MKKILIVSGGRSEGNTLIASSWVAEGVRSCGIKADLVECVRLSGIATGCISCGSCRENGDFRCVLPDDTSNLVAKLPEYDLIVLATPVYWFSYSTKLKGFIDRFYSLVDDSNGEMRSPLTGKPFALVVTGGGTEADSGVTAVRASFRQMLDYLGAEFAGELFLPECQFAREALRKDALKRRLALDFGHRIATYGGDDL